MKRQPKARFFYIDYCTSQATAIVAVYVADLYETALRYVTDPLFSCFEQKFPKTFKTYMKSKLHLYGAIGNFHTPVISTSERAVGERLARLQRVKEHITSSLGYAQELGGLTLTIVQVSSIYKSYAEVYTAAFDCTDSANSAIHHHTPYDEKLLAPLRRPTEALVNPIGTEELVTLISMKPDILSGLLSPTNRAELQKIKSESEKLANDGQQKIKSILESCQKYIVLIRTIPNIGEFPISEHSSRNYCDVQSKALDLIKEMQSYQKDVYLLSNKELIGCLQKLQKYSEEDLGHAKRCVSQLVPLITESSDPIKYNKLKALKSAIKLLSGDVFQQHFDQIGSLTAQYEGKISDIEVNLGNQETMKSLYTISEIDLRVEALKNSWTKISHAIKINSSKIHQVYNEGLKLSLEFKELLGDNCFENNGHQLVKVIANKKIHLIALENKLKEISSKFESIMGSLAQEYKSSKNLLTMIGNLQSHNSQIQELTQSLIAVRGFRKHVIKAIHKSIEIRHESCILLSSTLKLDGPRAKDSLDHGVNFSDPYLVLMLNQQELEPIPQFKEPVNLNSLIRTLTDLYILPLDHEVSRQESLQRLAEEMQIRSNPVELELDRNIGSLNDLFVEMQYAPADAIPNHASSAVGIVHGISQLFKWARQSSKKDLGANFRAQKSAGNIVDSVDNSKLNDVIQENSLLKGKLSIAEQKISSRERQISSMQEKIQKLHESVQKQPKTPMIEKLKSYMDIARINSSSEAVIEPSTQTTNAIPNLTGSSPKDINIKKIFGREQQKLLPKKGILSIKKENEDIAKMLRDFN